MPRAFLFASLLLAAAPAPAQPDLARVERQVIDETNRFRAEEGRGPVGPDARLEKAAAAFARHMARTDQYGHEADGRTPAGRAESHGYAYCLVSENIAYQYSSRDFTTTELARRYVEGWKGSPGHRRNMLERDAVDTGVGVARSPKTGRYYAVQMFGRPKSATVEFRIANRAREAARYRVGDRDFSLGPGMIRIHTVCGSEEVELAGRDRAGEKALRPEAGDRFVIAPRAGRNLTLRREP